MTIQIKYLAFKGIEKKEQILFKSFLNLAKNELEYQVVILKESSDSGELPNIVIADSTYDFSADEVSLDSLPTIEVGNDTTKGSVSGYIVRPIQWSDFKTELTRLDLDEAKESEAPSAEVFAEDIEFAIEEEDTIPVSDIEGIEAESQTGKYDYELDDLTQDFDSLTNSEYQDAAEDINVFDGDVNVEKVGDDSDENAGEPSAPQVKILVTDDESASNNSVLVIETNSLDMWEMSESDIEEETLITSSSINKPSVAEPAVAERDSSADIELDNKLESGEIVKLGAEFWERDAEIYADREPLMFIKPERDLVYSYSEPSKWTAAIRKGPIRRLKMDSNWRPKDELTAYPISRLAWAKTIASNKGELASGLESSTEYILERWPHFDLIELDNMLLKLCTMLFVQPESPKSLMQKSGYSRTVVYGLVNACHELQILRVSDQFDLEKFSEMNANDGVFGKIKDVFRS